MAALGFRDPNFGWLSRVALALPVLLLALQLLRPDSQEALALRLQEARQISRAGLEGCSKTADPQKAFQDSKFFHALTDQFWWFYGSASFRNCH